MGSSRHGSQSTIDENVGTQYLSAREASPTGALDREPESAPFLKTRLSVPPTERSDCTWLPMTLRLPYLVYSFGLSLGLCILVATLVGRSSVNDGLGDDDGSAVVFFSWRFAPTLIATV